MESNNTDPVVSNPNTVITDYSEIYQQNYWPKHHFANDEMLTAQRFKELNTDVFRKAYSEAELTSFADQVILIARNHSPAHSSKQENDLFYSFAPLTNYVKESLDQHLQQNQLTEVIEEACLTDINNQINYYLRSGVLSKALVNELHFAKEASLLQGSTDEQQFNYYVTELTANPDWVEYFFEEYPLVVYKLYAIIKNAIRNIIELLSNFGQDRAMLLNKFDIDDTLSIHSLGLFAGDAHQQGKAVIIINFAKGKKLLYKPREVHIDNALVEFLKYLNGLGFNINYREITSLTVGDHSWVEFVANEACQSLEEVKEYFTCMGSMLCVFYILGAKDIIADNIIAHGPLPCFIDLELLINKDVPQDYALNYPYEILKVFLDSVYKVGMLPSWAKSNGRAYDVFMGGIVSLENQAVTKYGWVDKYSANMSEKAVETFLNWHKDKHLPEYQGKRYGIESFYDEFITGFKKTCDYFIKNKYLIDPARIREIFKHTKNRVILRETAVYDVLNKESHHPKYLASELSSLFLYDSLWCGYMKGGMDERIINSEIRQLVAGDIPFFYTTEGSFALYDGDNVKVHEYFFETDSAAGSILERIATFDPASVAIQLDIIQGMTKIYYENNGIKFFNKKNYVKVEQEACEFTNIVPQQALIALADDIAKDICSKSVTIKGEVAWLTKGRFSDTNNFSYAPVSSDMYEGSAGIAMFLLYMSTFFPAADYKSYAVSILEQGKKEFYYKVRENAFYINYNRLKNQINISPYAFPTSTLYLMDHVSYVHGEAYWDEQFALDICDWIKEYINKDSAVDLLNGLSGVIILMLNAYRRTRKDIYLEVALECGNAIIDKGEVSKTGSISWTYQDSSDLVNPYKSLGGFAHGSAGIMFALFELSKFTSDVRYAQTAALALQFDREQFDSTIDGWRDGRTDEVFDSASWCHGSAGIGLSRLLIGGAYQDEYLRQEMEIAVSNIMNRGLNNSHCLCHGDLGNLEILNALASRGINKEQVSSCINTYLHEYLVQTERGKQFRCGTGGDFELLGAFVGKAGVGYNLLRLAAWERIPSLLCLESPLLNAEHLH